MIISSDCNNPIETLVCAHCRIKFSAASLLKVLGEKNTIDVLTKDANIKSETLNIVPCPYCLSLETQNLEQIQDDCSNCETLFYKCCGMKFSPIAIHGNTYHRPNC